ncbi:sigma-54 interaction domain-containing protein [Allosphingosinicella indica]|uniref:Two-component system, response regulator FlrC n=1 Tax=Allosphingosinicella indica TaxID=941907 RepID=A0A1X7GNX3_9SPHN|nr:sigma 54-interacting transcriptional regulator [Allosphingosinicella indica]SMF72597.1 two-component system, response regulator FlrC [Allosphingosinicella indica]
MIGLSETAMAAHPALARWLRGAGLAVTIGSDGPRILDASEAGAARANDVVVEAVDGNPSLTISDGTRPACVRFGYDDMAFAFALVAELVRPEFRPACGEPESARLLGLADRIAGSDATVLILGETGTGKEGLARYIHSISPRANGAYVAVNCAALPDTMLEAILFGHRRGSFTGASADGEGLFRAADGGTLLLDEIAELPLALQAKLLRAIQEKEVLPVGAVKAEPVDVRIIACANRDLAAEVDAGRFRADLYWRLNVLPLQLQPLGARRLDIRAIAAALLLRHVPAGAAFPWPTAQALDRLMAHRWPGNCRELDNVLQRALMLRQGDRIETEDLSIDGAATTIFTAPRLADAGRSAEARMIREALAATNGHRVRAAERLGISERTLRYRLAGMRAEAA